MRLPRRLSWLTLTLISTGVLLLLTFCAQGDIPPASTPALYSPTVTYYHDIAPIMARSCAPCHNPGQVGPFPFQNYRQVKQHARQIVLVTQSHYMPPWLPDPNSGPFLHDRHLAPSQIARIQQWFQQGALAGNYAPSSPPPRLAIGWGLGKPDEVVRMPRPFIVPGDTVEVYRCFVIPISSPHDRWLRAIEYRPGVPAVVRSATIFLDTTGAARRLEAQSGAVGFAAFEAGLGDNATRLGEWSPDCAPLLWPAGVARKLPKQADLVLMLRFHPDGQQESEQSEVGLYFVKRPAMSPASITLGAAQVILRAAQTAVVTDSFTLPCAVHVFGVSPHAHAVCRTIESTAVLPGGATKTLLRIADWDVNWQEPYRIAVPPLLPAGTRVTFTCTLDNTADNPRNPSSPPMRLMYGLEHMDQAASLQLQTLPVRPQDAAQLRRSLRDHPNLLHIEVTSAAGPATHG